MKTQVAWVPSPHRYGGYSVSGVYLDGGKFVSEIIDEKEAKERELSLNNETKGSVGGYIVVYHYD
jgi:hypothetical protein